MKKIIIVTNNFPFSKGENTFILPEINVLKKKYNIEIITAGNTKEEKGYKDKFDLENIKVIKATYPNYTFKHKLSNLFRCLFSINYYKNIFSKEVTFKNIFLRENECRNFYLQARSFYKFLNKKGYFRKETFDNTIFYSFWSNSNLLGLCMGKKKNKNLKIIARANGYDLYNERTKGGHQPYKNVMDKFVDVQLFDAELNKKYYIDHFARNSNDSKYKVAYLGIEDNGVQIYNKKEDVINIVSCSNVIPLKRVNLIIDELSKIRNLNIKWTHFGDGELLKELKKYAKTKLGNNIKYEFKGYVDNKDIINYYKNNFVDLFIHLSETEGCPVSLTEAISFGIIIIATDAGGVREIVNDRNGKLLPVDFENGEVANLILRYSQMKEKDILEYRNNARDTFMKKFNNMKNSIELIKIFETLV